jgi:serine/threonine protein kinase/tetratricopeptide (TPR) repeat protein
VSDDERDRAADELLRRAWPDLAPLVDLLLDTPVDARPALLVQLSAGDAERQRALARLVVECERDVPLFNRPAAERFDQLLGEDEPTTLPELLGGRYRTGHEVGRGGMARVYLARDIKHDRDVAIKVIRAELSASMGRDRFLREIGIAARLRHPNILPLYDSGEANGALYFVMPFESGPSLRERLARDGPLSITNALSVLRDVARALQYAHAQGVVHRDIKPDNVLMSGGAAVVADFGIAKALSAARTNSSNASLTEVGAGIGTPAYMAPEQALGDPSTDHRADIYSFGCLAYELFTGKPPFHDLPTHQVIAAHVGTMPQPLRELRADIPGSVELLLAKCLAKDPDLRPQGASDLVDALEHPSAALQPNGLSRATIRIAAATAIGLVVVLGLFAWQRERNAPGPAIRVAVLPIANIAKDTSIELFADGLSDEIATALGRVPGIQIQSRSGARAYSGQLGVDVREAGRKLAADYVVTGAMRAMNGRWIITTELADASSGAELWSEPFDRSPAQQNGVAEEIAHRASAALRQRFPASLGVAPALASNQRTSNPEAYRLYVLGQELLRRRALNLTQSVDVFRQAIALDPRYARAYSGLSMALALYPYFQGPSPSDVFNEVMATATRALELDSTLAQPHVARGLAYQHNRQWEQAEDEYRLARQLESDEPEVHIQYGRHLLFRGRTREALQEFQSARHADPASGIVLTWVAYTYFLLGQRDSASAINEQALQIVPMSAPTRGQGTLIYLGLGKLREARALGGRSLYMLAVTGDSAQVRARLGALDNARPMSEGQRANALLGLHDTTAALTALERATDAGDMWYSSEPTTDPMYASVRGTRRFEALLRRVGLDPRPLGASAVASR